MRIKNANSHQDRQSQTKSMILTDAGKVTEPISRHRRNHSQHVLKDVIPPLEHPMVEKEGYLQSQNCRWRKETKEKLVYFLDCSFWSKN